MSPPFFASRDMPLAASRGLPPPIDRMQSQPVSLILAAPSSTVVVRGFSDTLSKTSYSTPSFSSCFRALSSNPVFAELLPVTTKAFLP